eukprot:m.14148 g.14148  ORF g.14148 m.14148 type:complete len:413 (-) comp10014_c0_seq2:428-1666(-)
MLTSMLKTDVGIKPPFPTALTLSPSTMLRKASVLGDNNNANPNRHGQQQMYNPRQYSGSSSQSRSQSHSIHPNCTPAHHSTNPPTAADPSIGWKQCSNGNGMNISITRPSTSNADTSQKVLACRPASFMYPVTDTWDPHSTYQLHSWLNKTYYQTYKSTLSATEICTAIRSPSPPSLEIHPAAGYGVSGEEDKDPSSSSWWGNMERWFKGLINSTDEDTPQQHTRSSTFDSPQPIRIAMIQRNKDRGFGLVLNRANGALMVLAVDDSVKKRSTERILVGDTITHINGIRISPLHDVVQILRGCGNVARLELSPQSTTATLARRKICTPLTSWPPISDKFDLVTVLTIFNAVDDARCVNSKFPISQTERHHCTDLANMDKSVEWLSAMVAKWSTHKSLDPPLQCTDTPIVSSA